ncbi:MAG: AMP-binding protein, partial [Polyangia bacterium]|nr:AMP-binding protein [Polyangia bacterium]
MLFDWLEDAARNHGTANAVVQKDSYLSFRGLVHRVQRRMLELRALGLEPGTAMGILLGNVSDYIVLALAANKLGAAVVPMAPQCSARELAHAMAVLPLRAVVSRPGLRALNPDGQLLAHEPRLPSPTKRTRLQGSLLSCSLYQTDGGPSLPPGTAIVHLVPGAAGPYFPVIRSASALSREAERLHATLGGMDRPRLGAALPLFQPFTLELALSLTCGYGAALHLDDDLAPRQTAHRARETSQAIWPVTRALLWSLVTLTPHRPLDPGSRLLCVDGPVGRALDQASHRALGIHPEGLLHCPEVGLVSMDSHGRAPSTVGAVVPGLEIRLVGPRQAPVAAG